MAFRSTTENRNYNETEEDPIPIKPCDEADFAGFSPSRNDQQSFIEKVKKTPKSFMCLDLDAYGKPIEIFGDFDSDVN